nr:hypothetical protein [Amycolatopsis sp. SID8362]
MQRWSVSVEGDHALFSCAPWLEGSAAGVLPRIWPGRGMGVSDVDGQGLLAAVAETMKTPRYWIASRQQAGAWQDQPWGVARQDPDDGFVYLTGPCGEPDGSAGYRPTRQLPIALWTLRGLRIRLAVFLRATTVTPPSTRHPASRLAPGAGSR